MSLNLVSLMELVCGNSSKRLAIYIVCFITRLLCISLVSIISVFVGVVCLFFLCARSFCGSISLSDHFVEVLSFLESARILVGCFGIHSLPRKGELVAEHARKFAATLWAPLRWLNIAL